LALDRLGAGPDWGELLTGFGRIGRRIEPDSAVVPISGPTFYKGERDIVRIPRQYNYAKGIGYS
jgi:hypothetical protein